jgi:hypothetical protein
MKSHLVVTRAFGPHAKGAIVDDPATIKAILASDHTGHVVQVTTPGEPQAAISEQEA